MQATQINAICVPWQASAELPRARAERVGAGSRPHPSLSVALLAGITSGPIFQSILSWLESHGSLPEIVVYLRQHQEDARPYPLKQARDTRQTSASLQPVGLWQFLSLSVLEQVADASIQQTKAISHTQRPPTSTHYAGRAAPVTCKVLPKRHSVKAIESLSMLKALPEMLRQQGRYNLSWRVRDIYYLSARLRGARLGGLS
jgi:hypothetical protein